MLSIRSVSQNTQFSTQLRYIQSQEKTAVLSRLVLWGTLHDLGVGKSCPGSEVPVPTASVKRSFHKLS